RVCRLFRAVAAGLADVFRGHATAALSGGNLGAVAAEKQSGTARPVARERSAAGGRFHAGSTGENSEERETGGAADPPRQSGRLGTEYGIERHGFRQMRDWQ